ncbi:MAG: diacylglycerol kinase family protein [Acholeplasmataceae bacterium]
MRYLLLYNPVSGRGKIKKKVSLIQTIFKERNLSLDIYESKECKDLINQAFLFSSKYDVFLVAGGDGTINEVVNGVMKADKKPSIAIIPTGTANDIASILGMKKKIRKSLDIILSTNPVLMDVNQMNDQYFIYTGSAGIFTRISYATKRKYVKSVGYLAYLLTGLKDVFKAYRIPLKIETNDKEIEGTYKLALGLSTNRVAGMFLRGFVPNKLNDGKFEFRLFNRKGFSGMLAVLWFFITGGRYNKEKNLLSAKEYKITTTETTAWNVDGEFSTTGSIEIKVHQQKLSVYVAHKSRKKYF